MINKLKTILKIIEKIRLEAETETASNVKKYVNNDNIFEKTDRMFDDLNEDTVKIEFGNDVKEFIESIIFVTDIVREQIKKETGFIFPLIHYLTNTNLQENEIKVYLNGNELYSKFIIPVQEETEKEIEEILFDLFNNHLSEIFSNESVEKYFETVKKYNGKLAADIAYNLSSIEVKYILIDLIKKGKSIKNISYVFEKIAEQVFIGKIENKNKLIELSEKVLKNI